MSASSFAARSTPGTGKRLGVRVPWRRRWWCRLRAEGDGVAVRWGRKEARRQDPWADRARVSRDRGTGRRRCGLPGRGERQEWSVRGSARTSRSDRRHHANAGLAGGADGEPVGAHSRAQRPIGARGGRRRPAQQERLGEASLSVANLRAVSSRVQADRGAPAPCAWRAESRADGSCGSISRPASWWRGRGRRSRRGRRQAPRSRHRSPPSSSRTSTPGSRHTVTASCAMATTCASSCADGGPRSGSRRASPASWKNVSACA